MNKTILSFVEGKEVSLQYMKKNGDLRKATATFDINISEKGITLVYYDKEVQGFRSFRVENLISIKDGELTLLNKI